MERMETYARLLLRTELDLQKGQTLLLNADTEAAPLVAVLAAQAYQMGAADVQCNWSNEACDRARLLYQDEENLGKLPPWEAERYNAPSRAGCAYLRLFSEDPFGMAGADPARIALRRNAVSAATKEAQRCRMTGVSPWLAAAYPGRAWAQRVFPNLAGEEAQAALWRAILAATRADAPDPDAAWQAHQQNLARRAEWLNAQQFAAFHYESGLGTDFTVGMPEGQNWAGGRSWTQDGRAFIPNMPTEEVFCAPHRDKVNGVVYGTKPYAYNGQLIEGWHVTFKNGCVVEHGEEKNGLLLAELLTTDENANRIGEIAFVPASSPINRSGVLFYDTLFDENAACHIAFGAGYPTNIKGGAKLSRAELMKKGLNDSAIHEDVMIGAPDTRITGLRKNGETVSIFENGEWAF